MNANDRGENKWDWFSLDHQLGKRIVFYSSQNFVEIHCWIVLKPSALSLTNTKIGFQVRHWKVISSFILLFFSHQKKNLQKVWAFLPCDLHRPAGLFEQDQQGTSISALQGLGRENLTGQQLDATKVDALPQSQSQVSCLGLKHRETWKKNSGCRFFRKEYCIQYTYA